MKVNQLYDMAAMKAMKDSHKKAGFTDSPAGLLLARSLTAIDPNILKMQFPDLVLVNESGITVDNTGGYAAQIQTLRVTNKGGFKRVGNKGDNKGKITLDAEDNMIKVAAFEATSDWTETQLKQASLENRNLVSEYVSAHNETYLEEVDQYGLVGEGSQKGLLNNAAYDTEAGTEITTSTAAQSDYDQISDLITKQHNSVNNTKAYKADTVMMPTRVLNILSRKILNTAAGSSNVLKALRDNYPDVKFLGTSKADTVARGGLLSASATVAYSSNPQSIKLRIPQRLVIGQIVKKSSFRFEVESMYRVAGVDILEGSSGEIATGL